MSSFQIIKNEILPKPIHMVTIFSVSEYILTPNDIHLTQKDITNIRLNEDIEFCRKYGISYHYFKFPDAGIRLGRAICDACYPLDNKLIFDVRKQLSQLIYILKPKIIVCQYPYGHKQHIDHRTVFHALSDIVRSKIIREINVYFLDDIPYSRIPLDTVLIWNNIYYVPKVFVVENVEEKYSAMNIYKSQMCEEYFKGIKKTISKIKENEITETLWVPVKHMAPERMRRDRK